MPPAGPPVDIPSLRDEFLKLAEAWDQLAEQREQEIAKGKVRAQPGSSNI
jgi:hypothetical protein